MNIFVCVKQVPDTETKVQISDDSNSIKSDSIKWVVNPYDEFAIEESLALKKALNAEKVYAVTLGPKKRIQDSLRVALAMGCDEGIVIDTDDTLNSLDAATAIKKAIEKTATPSLILTGKSSIDENSQAFTQQLAALFDVPHATMVTKITADSDTFTVERDVEAGGKETYEIKGLCVLGANKGLNSPRYPSLPGIMKAKKKPISAYTLSDLDVTPTKGLKFSSYKLPAPNPPAKILSGETSAQVDELVHLLKNEVKVL